MRISKAELTCIIVDIFLLILIIAGYVTGNGNTGLTLMILSNVVVRRIACIPEKKSIRILINAAGIALLTAGGMIWGMSRKAGGAQIEGTMQLVDNATGETKCEFEFAKVKGLLAPVFRARAISVYRYLADGLLKSVEK